MIEYKYGTATVGVGKPEQREIPIADYIRFQFKDFRLLSVASLVDDEGYVVSVENPPSSGRTSGQNMWLSEESLSALFAAIVLYFKAKGTPIEDISKKLFKDQERINYYYSDNIQPINIEDDEK